MKRILSKSYQAARSVFDGCGICKIYPFRSLNNLILKYIKSDFIVIGGHKMFLDSEDSLGLSTGSNYEEFETELIKKEIKKRRHCSGHWSQYRIVYSYFCKPGR